VWVGRFLGWHASVGGARCVLLLQPPPPPAPVWEQGFLPQAQHAPMQNNQNCTRERMLNLPKTTQEPNKPANKTTTNQTPKKQQFPNKQKTAAGI
jgi:hypothetical protein